MPKGIIKLTNYNAGYSDPRVALSNIAWYIRERTNAFTIVTLHSRSEGDSDTLHVTETEAEIDALIEAAQSEHAIDFTKPVRSEFAHGMGHALGAFTERAS